MSYLKKLLIFVVGVLRLVEFQVEISTDDPWFVVDVRCDVWVIQASNEARALGGLVVVASATDDLGAGWTSSSPLVSSFLAAEVTDVLRSTFVASTVTGKGHRVPGLC
ncbi:hypothetical protein BC940DRAFT_318552 [Gongronella butleri]|nr:hypothetical protein BC940DRAFT_318552 [Gongronella butleri]